MDGLRAFLRREHGIEPPDLRPAHTVAAGVGLEAGRPLERAAEGETEEEPEPEYSGTAAYAEPAGDLDGDGLADVLVYEVELPDEHITLRALRGLDGSELWHRDFEAADAVGVPLPDVTGDGTPDYLIFTIDILQAREELECDSDSRCHREYEADFVWRMGVQSGSDGRTLWEDAYPGHVEYVSDRGSDRPLTSEDQRSFSSTNLAVVPFLSGDHDGDALFDLVIDAIDVTWQSHETSTGQPAASREQGSSWLRSSTRAQVVNGNAGRVLYSRAMSGPSVSVLYPVGDLTGDATTDLVSDVLVIDDSRFDCLDADVITVCSEAPQSNRVTLEIELLDGASFASAWKLSEPGLADAIVWPLEADADDDSWPDLLLFEVKLQDSEPLFTETLVSGHEGSVRWRRTSPRADWEIPIQVAELGGAAGSDILMAFIDIVMSPADLLTAPSWQVELDFVRLEGKTGEAHGGTTTELAEVGFGEWAFIVMYLGTLDDASGDVIDDAFGGAFVVSSTDGMVSANSGARVESSTSGASIYDFRRQGLWDLYPVEDVDGDSRADAFEWYVPLGEGETRVSMIGLAQRTALWTQDISGDTWLATAGDQDGAPGIEVLLNRVSEDGGRYVSSVSSLAGASGATRWMRDYP